jgi:hypothetical protein
MRFLTSDFFFSMNRPAPRPKICQKLQNGSSQVADLKLQTSEKIASAELQSCGCRATFLQLQSYRIAIAEVLPSSCEIAIAEKKKLTVPTSGFNILL